MIDFPCKLREHIRIQRDESVPNTDVNLECVDDPVAELISIWVAEFLECTHILEDRHKDETVIANTHVRLRELERKICVVLNVDNPRRVGVVAKAIGYARRAGSISSNKMIANVNIRICSADALETVYMKNTRKKRSSSHRAEKPSTRALRILCENFTCTGTAKKSHISLSGLNMSDVDVSELSQGLDFSVCTKRVSTLDLSLNHINSALVLVGLLRLFPDVTTLDLRRNRVSDPVDIISLVTCVLARPDFKVLDLRENLVNLSVLSIALWFHIERFVIEPEIFIDALGKVRITTNKTCRDILP